MKPVEPAKLLANVGRRIAELRAEAGLTQEALSEELGVTTRWVQSAEGGRENLTLSTLARFATALGRPVGDFFATPASLKRKPGRPRKSARPSGAT